MRTHKNPLSCDGNSSLKWTAIFALLLFLPLKAVAEEGLISTPTLSVSPRGISLPPLPQESLSKPLPVLGASGGFKAIDLTVSQDDLWERIRNGFAMPNINDDLTLYYQQRYQNQPDALRRMVIRARPFLHHIVEEIEARGMPTELALLPMVESAFNPVANSPAKASGLWQFIPSTGKRFNLEQNWWKDQRRDILASTAAALDYLQSIYEQHGDWHLALASYNWGEGAVGRAIAKNEAKELPTDYLSLKVPNETRHYVPKLQALKNIFSNPALMAQLGLNDIPNRPYLASHATSRAMDVRTAAKLANMSFEEFTRLNPAYKRQIIKADSEILLPANKLATFRANLENYAAPLNRWEAYRLRPGEKLSEVAVRFGIPLTDLLRINSLSARSRLAAGSTLIVPTGKGSEDISGYIEKPAVSQTILPVPSPKKTSHPSKNSKTKHAVHGKEIAQKSNPHKTLPAKNTSKKPEVSSKKTPASKPAHPAKVHKR